MSKTFFDMGYKNTFNYDIWGWYDNEDKPKEWPPWLTAPIHYQLNYNIDLDKNKDYTFHFLRF
jgi:hypothetical protein